MYLNNRVSRIPLLVVGICLFGFMAQTNAQSMQSSARGSSLGARITCVGNVFWEATNQARRAPLRVQPFDANYLEARIDDYVFGALVDQIGRGEIILTASDSAAERSALASVGFAPLPDGTSYATAKYIFQDASGGQVWLETSCYLGKTHALPSTSAPAPRQPKREVKSLEAISR